MKASEILNRKFAITKTHIIIATGVELEEYNSLVFNTGIEWLVKWSLNNDGVVSKLSNNSGFWRWWLNQWNLVDDNFHWEHLDYMLEGDLHANYLKPLWLAAHDINKVVAYPSEAVLRVKEEVKND